MSANVTRGGCLCGSVRYEAAGTPCNITHCHCEDCRRSSGAAFVTWASFRRSDFRFTSGQPREVQWAGRVRAFCPNCGTPLTFLARPDADEVDVTVCSFDQPERVTPGDHTWVDDRLRWIQMSDDLPTHGKQRTRKAATQPAPSLPSTVLETCLDVDDLARAREFYTGLFGYAVMDSDNRFCALNAGPRRVLILFLRGSNPQGTVLPCGTIPSHHSSGPAHIGFGIPAESLNDWLSRLRERGIPVESTMTWPGGGTSVYFRDPEGHLLELATPGIWAND